MSVRHRAHNFPTRAWSGANLRSLRPDRSPHPIGRGSTVALCVPTLQRTGFLASDVDVDYRPIPQDRNSLIDHDLNVGNGVEPPIVDVARHDPLMYLALDQAPPLGLIKTNSGACKASNATPSASTSARSRLISRSFNTATRDIRAGYRISIEAMQPVVIERLHLYFHPKSGTRFCRGSRASASVLCTSQPQ
jgi:hypothetical protein